MTEAEVIVEYYAHFKVVDADEENVRVSLSFRHPDGSPVNNEENLRAFSALKQVISQLDHVVTEAHKPADPEDPKSQIH